MGRRKSHKGHQTRSIRHFPFVRVQLKSGFSRRAGAGRHAEGNIEIGGGLPLNTHGDSSARHYPRMNGIAEAVEDRGTSGTKCKASTCGRTAGNGVPTRT